LARGRELRAMVILKRRVFHNQATTILFG
jgi:hypothetical protein